MTLSLITLKLFFYSSFYFISDCNMSFNNTIIYRIGYIYFVFLGSWLIGILEVHCRSLIVGIRWVFEQSSISGRWDLWDLGRSHWDGIHLAFWLDWCYPSIEIPLFRSDNWFKFYLDHVLIFDGNFNFLTSELLLSEMHLIFYGLLDNCGGIVYLNNLS